jgi:hypothetical protein
MNRLRNLLITIWILVAVGIIALFAFILPQVQAAQAMIASDNATSTALVASLLTVPSSTPAPPATATVLTDTPTATSTRSPSPTPSIPSTPITLTPEESHGINPLTGLSVSDPAMLNRRPIAVKITNYPRTVRNYQFGLSQADIVYEYYIEDGLSRFIAVFYSKDATTAGPVRSGRYFDEHIARMYHSILVFANADERVEQYLINSNLLPFLFVSRGDNCPPLCRNTRIEGYNNLFLDTSGVGKFLAYRKTDNSRQKIRPTFFGASQGADITRPKIDNIYTFYSIYAYNYWEFDPNRNVYLRYGDTQDVGEGKAESYAPQIDQLNGEQVTADNVVVLVVPHEFKTEYDRADQVFDIRLWGEGQAYIFHSGNMYLGKWTRDTMDQPIRLSDPFNNPIGLNKGVTFYEVINPESSITQHGKNMNFTFFIPPRGLTTTPDAIRIVP